MHVDKLQSVIYVFLEKTFETWGTRDRREQNDSIAIEERVMALDSTAEPWRSCYTIKTPF